MDTNKPNKTSNFHTASLASPTYSPPSKVSVAGKKTTSIDVDRKTRIGGITCDETEIEKRAVATDKQNQSLLIVSGKSYLPENLTIGFTHKFVGHPGSISGYVKFQKSSSSLKPDNVLGEAIQSREECSKKTISSGANGYVQSCSVERRPCVVKRIYALKMSDADPVLFPDSFGLVTEARVLSGLNQHLKKHPGFNNIVPFKGAGVTDKGEPYLLLGKADQSLSAKMKQTTSLKDANRLKLDEAISYAAQMYHGLSVLAEVNLVHQDVKPDNLLIKGSTLWVGDFGEVTAEHGIVTRSLQDEHLPMRPGGTSEGKPFWPDYEPLSPATDVWAGGLVLMRMLVGDAAFEKFHDELHRPDGLGTQPWNEKPLRERKCFDQLSSEELMQIKQNIDALIDKTLEGQLTDSVDKETLISIIKLAFDPDASKRASAAVLAQKLYALNERKPKRLILSAVKNMLGL